MSFLRHLITLILLLFITGESGWTSTSRTDLQHHNDGRIAIIAQLMVITLYLVGVALENTKMNSNRNWAVIWISIILTMISLPMILKLLIGSTLRVRHECSCPNSDVGHNEIETDELRPSCKIATRIRNAFNADTASSASRNQHCFENL